MVSKNPYTLKYAQVKEAQEKSMTDNEKKLTNKIAALEAELEKLRNSCMEAAHFKRKARILEDSATEAIVVMNDKMEILDVNRHMLDMLNYSREEVIGKSGLSFVDKEYFEALKKRGFSDHAEPMEAKLIRKDKSTVPIIIQGDFLNINGKKIRVTTCRDMSKMKDLNKQIEEKTLEFESIFLNSGAGISFNDGDRIVRKVNDETVRILGYDSADELIGKSMKEFHYSEAGYNEFGNLYGKALLERKSIKVDQQFVKKDGTPIWLSVSGRVVDQNDPPDLSKGIVWVFEDITKRKETELALKKAHDELQTIFSNTMVGIVMLLGGRYVYRANMQTARILGYDNPDEMKGKSVELFHISHDNYVEFGKKFYYSLTHHKVQEVDFKLKRKDGSEVWCSISGQAIDKSVPANLDNGVLWVIKDITDRKTVEQEKENLIQDLQKALAEIRSLQGIVPICSHCKKIRDDSGYWKALESYIQEHSEASFSHGICPDCAKKYFPDYVDDIDLDE